jgi:nucleoside-diphosphate kinase
VIFSSFVLDLTMATVSTEIWQFIVEWYDPVPQLKKQFLLKYFIENHMVEMIDLKNKKIFLKKCPCPPEIASSDLFLGSKILLFSRELEIVDYGDQFTRTKLQMQLQPSLVILTTKIANFWGRVVDKILSGGRLQIKCLRTIYLSDSSAEDVCDSLQINQRKRGELTEGPCLLVTIQGEDGIRELEYM